MKRFRLIFQIGMLLMPLFTMATPIPPTKPIDLKGEIVRWVWRGPMHYAEEDSGMWFEGDEPAHYLIVVDVPGVDREQLERLTNIVSTMRIRHEIMDGKLKPNEVLLFVPSKRLKEIRLGIRLEITNYTLTGDERMTVARFEKFTIDGQEPTSAGPLFPSQHSKVRARKTNSPDVPTKAKKRN